MIKEIFIPEKIGSYYITKKKFLGFDIRSNSLYTTQIYAKEQTLVIEKFFDVAIESKTNKDALIETAIRQIFAKSPRACVHSSISSSHAIFKTLQLPFTSREKIAQVVAYEVEPMLPFPLKEAVIDFIITHSNHKEQVSEVLVVAVQKKYIQEAAQPFVRLNHPPALITIDMIALYHLYKSIPQYNSLEGTTILLDLGTHETKLVYILNGQLKLIRTLSKSIIKIYEQLSTQYTEQQIADQLLNTKEQKNESRVLLEPFWKEILFTINSFRSQVGTSEKIQILILGPGSQIRDITRILSKKLSIASNYFEVKKLLENKNIRSKVSLDNISNNIISLAVALPPKDSDGFNLYKAELAQKSEMLYKSLITLVTLSFGILVTLIIFNLFQTRKFKKELYASMGEAKTLLVDTFGNEIKPKTTKGLTAEKELRRLVENAERKLQEKEKMWFAFSAPAQVTFLRYLYEIFTGLDRQELGLQISKLGLKEGILSLEGSVKDYDALEQFDRFIQASPLLGKITRGSLQEPEFKIDIELNKSGEE